MRSGRCARPTPRSTQSPQLRKPSEAVHGRSKAKRTTLTVATRMAAPHTGHGRPNTAAYCAERARPISPRSLHALDDEPLDAAGLGAHVGDRLGQFHAGPGGAERWRVTP